MVKIEFGTITQCLKILQFAVSFLSEKEPLAAKKVTEAIAVIKDSQRNIELQQILKERGDRLY